MKKLIISLFVAVSVFAAAPFVSYKPLNITVGTNSVLIAPSVLTTTTNTFTSHGTATYGDLLLLSNSTLWCVTTGTNDTAAFTPVDGDNTSSNAVWRMVRRVRNFISIQNHGATNVYLGFGNAAEKDKGIMLLPNASWTSIGGVPQGDIYAIGEATGLVLTIQEN